MTPTLQRRLYASIIRLHPAAFRNHFGREMLLDYEDARATQRFAPLCLDALLSLGRQWSAHALPGPNEQLPTPRASLLAGDYIAISPGGPTLFNLFRASILATTLLLTLCFVLKAPTRPPPHRPPHRQWKPGERHPQPRRASHLHLGRLQPHTHRTSHRDHRTPRSHRKTPRTQQRLRRSRSTSHRRVGLRS